jgi:hypothetical protein
VARVASEPAPAKAPHRKTTDYAVWQIKVTPQEAIDPSITIEPFAGTV